MAYRVEWDPDRQLLICTSFGTIDGQEVCALIREAARKGGRERGEGDDTPQKSPLDVCCDCRGVRGLVVTPPDLPNIVACMRWFTTEHPYGRTAIVTARLIDKTMAKLLVLMTSGSTRDRKQFDSMDEAEAWITQSSPLE